MISRRHLTLFILPLVSLLLSILLWYHVVGQKEREWTFSVPIFVRVPSSDVSGWAMPEKVSVVLRGPQRIIDGMAPDDLLVRLVLAENQPGEFTRAVIPSMIAGKPGGVEIVRIEPAEVRIEIRPLIETRFKVAPVLRASPDGLFRPGAIVDLEPRFAELRGTRQALKDITEIATEPIIVSGPPGRRSSQARLVVPSGVRVHPLAATVTYQVESTAETTTP
jgi:YbbR domain-containing protein